MGFFIPDTMKKYNNWVLQKNKIPIDPRTGRATDPTKSCCSYEDATIFLEYGNISCDGLGFTFTKENNLTFIDLDNCIDENGEYTPLAEEMTELFSDCYQEVSLSESGLHIVCIGSVPRQVKNKDTGIEIYSCNHYMAVTGNFLTQNEPQEAQERLECIFDRYATQKAEIEPQEATQNNIYRLSITAESLIEVIKHSRQGKKWERLHNGNILEYNNDVSAGVQAYINITNYYAGGDVELIKEVMMQSCFANTKHIRDDYINRSVAKAKQTATGNIGRSKRTSTKEIDEYEPQRKKRRRV